MLQYHLCSILNESYDTYVLEKCILLELHLLQGFVNHLFWKGIVCLVENENALVWSKELQECLPLKHSWKMLKNTYILLDNKVLARKCFLKMLPFVAALNSMSNVVNHCFSSREVGENLKANSKELIRHVKALNTSITLKIHVVI